MATASKKSGETSADIPQGTGFSAPMDFADMSEINYTAMNAAGELGRRWGEMLTEINGELFRFVGKRFKEDIAIPTELAKCKTSEEIFEIYSDFVKRAVNQYSEEAEALAHIGADFVGTATRVVEAENRDVHNIAAD